MRHVFSALLLLLFFVICTSHTVFGQAPKLTLGATEFNFGTVKEGAVLEHTFTVKNEGTAKLQIHNVAPTCGCTASDFPRELAPAQTGKITLTVKTEGMSGITLRNADIFSNDQQRATIQLWLRMNVVKENEPSNAVRSGSIYDFELNNIDGQPLKLAAYQGKVLLIVNVASKCGFTPQYEALQSIYAQYQAQGFEVLGIPANNFLGQEPGTNEEIKTFCQTKYKVTFPMFAKISVKGTDIHPLYQFLTNKTTNPGFGGEITWNFNKFLIDRTGKIIARFATKEKPDSETIRQAIEQALKP